MKNRFLYILTLVLLAVAFGTNVGAQSQSYTDAWGTTSPLFHLQNASGPLIRNNAGAVEIRNAANTAFGVGRGATPITADDLTPKGYADGNIAGRPASASAPATGNAYVWNGAQWVPGSPTSFGAVLPPVNGGSGVASPPAHDVLVSEGASPFNAVNLGDAQFLIGQTGADPAAKTLSGDLVCVDTGVCTVDGIRGVSVPSPPGTGTSVLTDTTGALSWSAAFAPGITQLTGRGTAGPGSGSQVFALAASGIAAATYGSSSSSAVCAFSADGTASSCASTPITASLPIATGLLPLANFTPGTNGQVLTTVSGASTWATPAPNGITQLTGAVIAGPGSGSQVASLSSTGVAVGSCGDASHVGVVLFAADGRASACTSTSIAFPSSLPPSGSAGGRLAGTYPNPSLAVSGIAAATYGSSSSSAVCAFSADGTASSCASTPITASLPIATGNLNSTQIAPGTNGQVFATVGGVSAWENLPGSTQPGATLVCNPAGPASPNVFTTWSSLMSTVALVNGPVTIVVTGTCHVTTGTWTFSNANVRFIGGAASFANILLFDNGAQITEPATQDTVYYVENLFVESQSSLPGFPIPDGNPGFVQFNVYDNAFFGTSFFFTATAPMVKTGPLGTTQTRVFIRNGRIGGATPAFDLTTSTRTSNPFILLDRSLIVTNAILDPGNTATTEVDSPSAQWNNAPNVFLVTAASALGYIDTSPTLGSGNVQGAIDALKSKILPTTGSNGQVLSVVAGAPAWTTPPTLPGTTLVWCPSCTAGPNVFTSWASLYTASQLVTGAVNIETFNNGVLHIPAGTWSFANGEVTFIGNSPTTGAFIVCDNGAVITWSTNTLNLRLYGTFFESGSSAAVFTVPTGKFLNFYLYEFSFFGSGNFVTPITAIVKATGAAGVTVAATQNSFIGGGTVAVIDYSASTSVNLGQNTIRLGDAVVLQNNAIISNGSGIPNIVTVSTSPAIGTGNPAFTRTNFADLEAYNDTSPTLGSSNVQGAIDALKGRTTNTVPNPGANGTVLTVVSGAPAWAAPSGGSGITALTNDVTASGSGSVPAQVNSASGTSPFLFKPSILDWLSATTAPTITQQAATAGLNGATITMLAQAGGSGNTNGGGAVVQGGAASGSGTPGTAALVAGNGAYGFAATPFGFSLGGTTGSRASWTSNVSGPTLTQDTGSGAGATMTVQAQGGGGSGNGGTLDLLGGLSAGGAAGGVIVGTGDGANVIAVTPGTIDLNGVHNYRIGNWAGNFGTGVGYVMLLDETSPATALLSGGLGFASRGGNLEVNAASVQLSPFSTTPGFTQETPASGNGATMQIVAQKGATSGTTVGGALLLGSGAGFGGGLDGAIELANGNGSNGFILPATPSGGNATLEFLSTLPTPVITQLQGSGNGQPLTLRAQGGGSGTFNGGDTIVQGGVQGTSGLGSDGRAILQSADTTNSIVVLDDGFTGTGSIAGTPYVQNTSANSVAGLGYAPSMTYASSNHISQAVFERKHVDVCHIVSPSASSAACGVSIPMQVPHSQVHMQIVTQCRVTTAGTGTSISDNVTSDGFGDWVQTTSGAGAPTTVSSSIYNQQSSGSSGVFAPITYLFGGNTTGSNGYVTLPFTVRTNSGLNLGTVDCTTWTTEKYN